MFSTQAFNEDAFRYLLGVQRKRSERSEQPFLLLLVDLDVDSGSRLRIHPAVARKLVSGLCRALRETDLVGWYREERIAGALLTTRGGDSWAGAAQIVSQRITEALAQNLPSSVAQRVRVRTHYIRPHVAARFSQRFQSW